MTAPFDLYDRTVISQYANSPILTQLIANFSAYFDPTANFDQFYSLVWNVDTAQGWGLDVLGRIVGVSRVVAIPVGDFFGFASDPQAQTFGHGIFYSGAGLTNNFSLADDAFRRLILVKALANISDGSIPSINAILISLFPSYGNSYVRDNLDMTLTYVFGSALSPVDKAIAITSGVLPKPAGVSATVEP